LLADGREGLSDESGTGKSERKSESNLHVRKSSKRSHEL
jgi:hypothetical protein